MVNYMLKASHDNFLKTLQSFYASSQKYYSERKVPEDVMHCRVLKQTNKQTNREGGMMKDMEVLYLDKI